MAVILSPRGNEASNMMKRFVRYEEAAQYFGIDETLIVAYAKAAGAVYQLSKEKKFSKTEVAKKPWKWQKKVYESLVLHLDAAIDKVEDLSRDVELDRMDKKQIDKPEQVTDIRDAMASVSSVAEPAEYQFGAEAFEAAYPKMDSVIKQDAKAPSVPKTGKVR